MSDIGTTRNDPFVPGSPLAAAYELPRGIPEVPKGTSPANLILATAIFLILAFSASLISRHYPITQALIQVLVYAFFLMISHRHPEVRTEGWAYILIGANLVTFGALVEISQYVPFLQSHLTETDSAFRVFLKQVVGTNTGFLLFGYGFYRWLPSFIVSRNVMEQLVRRYQAELVRNEKLNALAGLVSSVAHELNNPLSVLVGYANILRTVNDPALMTKAVAEMERAAMRCKKVADNLLVFARKPTFERREVHIPLVVDEAVQLLDYQLRLNSVTVEKRYEPNLPPTVADRDQLLQVFFNLINNAMQALADRKDDRRITLYVNKREGLVVVEIGDNGPGVPPDIQDKIFKAFFTTKPVGVGTGLGLSICRGIMKSHNGELRLESVPNKRTAFICEIPITNEGPEEQQVPEDPPSRADFEGRRFLIVDDEDTMLDFIRLHLGTKKCEAEYCCSGAEALETIEKTPNFDLVLLDLRMPKMSGQEVFARIATSAPALVDRVMFMTGDSARDETIRFLRSTGRPCLLKPFVPADLDKAFADALSAGAGRSSGSYGRPRLAGTGPSLRSAAR
jgi:signal transduction histidine kinase/CheY-like chemotaxis protein